MKKIETIETPRGKRKRVMTINNEPSMTDPQWVEDCDVNTIVNKFLKTGQLTHLAQKTGLYQDVSEVPDLQEAFAKVQLAGEAFQALPAELRKKLDHDPVKLVEYLNDPKNDEEAIKYGLKVSKKSSPVVSDDQKNAEAGASATEKP